MGRPQLAKEIEHREVKATPIELSPVKVTWSPDAATVHRRSIAIHGFIV